MRYFSVLPPRHLSRITVRKSAISSNSHSTILRRVRLHNICLTILCVSAWLSGSIKDSGIHSFMKRAVNKANSNLNEGLAQRLGAASQASSSKSEIVDLVKCIRNEEAKVHMDLDAKLKVLSCLFYHMLLCLCLLRTLG